MPSKIDKPGWIQAMIAVVLCIGTGIGVYTAMNTKITEMKASLAYKENVIEELKSNDKEFWDELNTIKLNVSDLRNEVKTVAEGQNRVVLVIGKLDSTLNSVTNTLTKLETRLDYANKED